jgi:hypothetical protein
VKAGKTMCYELYLASESQLPLIEWIEHESVFCTENLANTEEGVRRQFTKPHVYFVGSYEGCSCGFFSECDEEQEEIKASIQSLRAYVLQALETSTELEIFACWSGSYENTPKKKLSLTPEQLCDGEEFPLDEDYFAVIRKPHS